MGADVCKDRTKNDLDRALRQLLEQKPLDQIRIRELTALCQIRRQSFYYHFPDVWALFDWSLQQETAALLRRQELCLTWQQALTDLLHQIGARRTYYQALLNARGRSGLREVLREVLHSLLTKTIAYYQPRCGLSEKAAANSSLFSCWETLLLAMLDSWIQGDLLQAPEELLSFLETLVTQATRDTAWKHTVLTG